jgi:acetyltransferase-like isoleucine patch superfamily enzyme
VSGLIGHYLRRYRQGRVYSHAAYLLGAVLRRRFSSAGAVAWLRGAPMPEIRPGGGRIDVGDIGVYPGVRMLCGPGARIRIGDGSYINRSSLLHAEEEISVGRHTMISWDVIVTDTDGVGGGAGAAPPRPVWIGDHAWIGARAVILGGAHIGDGALIAGGAVVSGEVPPGAIVVSNPARAVGPVAELSVGLEEVPC